MANTTSKRILCFINHVLSLMKKNILLSILLLAFCTAPLTASKGWYWDYVILNVNNSSNNYYWFGGNPKVYTQFDKTNLGTVTNLEIAGCDMRYWSSSKDRTGGSFFYKIMIKYQNILKIYLNN